MPHSFEKIIYIHSLVRPLQGILTPFVSESTSLVCLSDANPTVLLPPTQTDLPYFIWLSLNPLRKITPGHRMRLLIPNLESCKVAESEDTYPLRLLRFLFDNQACGIF